ncbi:MAG TPA: hypothetical protein VJI67_00185, partial [archaeon]|nr:hypothetical protein [archaeon]
NSEKIGNLFTTFSRDSQFITITHNEVLLKNVDQIVGVAKGADGTSVIGVKLPKGEAQAPIVA